MKRSYIKRKTPMKKYKRVRMSRANVFSNKSSGNGRAKDSRDYIWSEWNMRCWNLYLEKVFGPGKHRIVCMCGCNETIRLVVDHRYPRSNFRRDAWDPCNGQVITWGLNSEKGSSHGKKWEFRSWEYRVFQRWLRAKEWRHDIFEGWIKKDPSEEGPREKDKS